MIKTIAANKKAYHEYLIEDTVEAGVALTGTEVKSLRLGNVQMRDCFAWPRGGELFLNNLHISEYSHGNIQNHDPTRPRKLLMHKAEIEKWTARAAQKGLAIVPLKLYFKNGRVKVELGLGKGKKLHDKRETLKRKAVDRDMERGLRIKHRH